jgi:SlyX protein
VKGPCSILVRLLVTAAQLCEDMNMTDRLQSAEEHITHLIRHVEDLSDQVARQANEIDRLKARFDRLIERLSKSESGEDSDIPLLEQRPPHW